MGTLVYLHLRATDNTVFYIGIGTLERAHNKYNRTKYWKAVATKYGYKVHIMYNSLTREEASLMEQKLIKYYRSLPDPKLVNLTEGGDTGALGYRHTKETKDIISDAKKGHKVSDENRLRFTEYIKTREYTPELRAKLSAGQRARDNSNYKLTEEHIKKMRDGRGDAIPFKGCKHTEETKRLISEKGTQWVRTSEQLAFLRTLNTGRVTTEETKAKLRTALTGKKRTAETKQKMRDVNLGKKLSVNHKEKIGLAGLGRNHSEETLAKMREAQLRRRQLERELNNG